jgi:uncharacterized membrane protein YqjE
MDRTNDGVPHLGNASKRLARQVLVICGNRLELLLVELEQERDKVALAAGLGFGVVIFALLAGVAVTIAIVVACWQWSPVGAVLIVAAIYAAVAGMFTILLVRFKRAWRILPGTMDELRKDHACLEKSLN